MKIGALLLAIVLFGATTTQPSFAKDHRAHRAGTSALRDRPVQDGRPQAGNPVGAQAKGTNHAGALVPPPRNPSSEKRNLPASFLARRVPVSAPSGALPRNSIGEAIAPHDNVTAVGGGHFGPAVSGPLLGTPAIERQHPGPMARVSTAGRSTVDGAGLIRPAVAPNGLGGPAKVVAGINGTTLRSKR